jgi:hypothetical protein
VKSSKSRVRIQLSGPDLLRIRNPSTFTNMLLPFLISWGGVSPLGTSSANWPILPAPDDR